MAGRAQLTIDVTATTSGAVADLDKAKNAVKDYGDAADTATRQSKDVSGSIETVGGVAGGATTGLRDMSDAIVMAGFPELAAGMGVTATALESLDGAATLYAAAQEGLSKAVVFFDGILKALKFTILTNPIFLIAAIIIGIAAAFIIAYKNCETFRNIVDAAVRFVWDTIQTVYHWVADNWPLLLAILTGPFGLAVLAIIKHRDSIWDAIKAVYNWIRNTWDAILGFLTSPFEAAWGVIKGVFDKIRGAIDTVVGLLGKIKFPSPPKWFTSLNPFSMAAGASPSMFAAQGVARAPAVRTGSAGAITLNVNVNPLSGNPYILGRQISRTINRAVFIDGPITGKIYIYTTEFLTPTPAGVLTPTPGVLADILHVELATGARADTTYGTDTYGSWDYGGKQAWDRWDCDITSVSLFRGRQTKLERNSPGVCYFTAVQIVPAGWLTTPPTARPARLVTSTNRVVFYGYIETANLNREYGTAEWQVTIVDDLARLGRLEIGTLVRPVEYIWERIDALLTAAGMLPQTDPPSATPVAVQAVNGSGRKVLDEIGIAVDTWRSTITNTYMPAAALVDRTGWFTVRMAQRQVLPDGQDMFYVPWRISPTPAAHAYNNITWLGDAMHAELSADLADLRNYLTLSSAGNTAEVFQDSTSVSAYGPRSYQRMDLIADAKGHPTYTPSNANLRWSQMAMEPTPKTRLKTVSVDCWNRPAGAAPLVDILANLDVTHMIEVFLPDQDDAGGDIANVGLPGGTADYIFGMSWELTDRSATLTLTLDCPIKIV